MTVVFLNDLHRSAHLLRKHEIVDDFAQSERGVGVAEALHTRLFTHVPDDALVGRNPHAGFRFDIRDQASEHRLAKAMADHLWMHGQYEYGAFLVDVVELDGRDTVRIADRDML